MHAPSNLPVDAGYWRTEYLRALRQRCENDGLAPARGRLELRCLLQPGRAHAIGYLQGILDALGVA
jgi:hypothetical protein